MSCSIKLLLWPCMAMNAAVVELGTRDWDENDAGEVGMERGPNVACTNAELPIPWLPLLGLLVKLGSIWAGVVE